MCDTHLRNSTVPCHPSVQTRTVQTEEPLLACTDPWFSWSAEYWSHIHVFPVLETQGSAVHQELGELEMAL